MKNMKMTVRMQNEQQSCKLKYYRSVCKLDLFLALIEQCVFM